MKWRSIVLLLVAELAAMSLWFVSAAILPEMLREAPISEWRQAALSSAVQAGFVFGALISAILGLPDRFDPRRVLATCAALAGASNILLIAVEPGGLVSIASRFATGALLAGVYPVGMKIAVGWGQRDRGFLVSAIVGALTLGSAIPHLLAYWGGTDWRATVITASAAAALGSFLVLRIGLGPYHAQSPSFDPRAIAVAWTNRRVRLAYIGYLGHMWELYAMWAWLVMSLSVSYAASINESAAVDLARLTACAAIAAGALACLAGGLLSDRIGKAETAAIAMALSASSALLVALSFGGPIWLTVALAILWGLSVIPDSAQFSALVADAAPANIAGSLMTFQTALGFALTFFTVQLVPLAAASLGWPIVIASLALGPIIGIAAMLRLRALNA